MRESKVSWEDGRLFLWRRSREHVISVIREDWKTRFVDLLVDERGGVGVTLGLDVCK